MFLTKVVEGIKTHTLRSVTFSSPEKHAVCEKTWINMIEPAGHKWQYGPRALHAG